MVSWNTLAEFKFYDSVKTFAKQIGLCTFVVVVNLSLSMILPPFYIQCMWGMLCLWIFMDSMNLCFDLRVLEAEKETILKIYNRENTYREDIVKHISHNLDNQFMFTKVMASTLDTNFSEMLNEMDIMKQAIIKMQKKLYASQTDVESTPKNVSFMLEESYKARRNHMTKQDSLDDLYVGTKNENVYLIKLHKVNVQDDTELIKVPVKEYF